MWPMLVTDFLRIFERSFYSLPRISNLAQHICSPDLVLLQNTILPPRVSLNQMSVKEQPSHLMTYQHPPMAAVASVTCAKTGDSARLVLLRAPSVYLMPPTHSTPSLPFARPPSA
jgi:hypothetical protein